MMSTGYKQLDKPKTTSDFPLGRFMASYHLMVTSAPCFCTASRTLAFHSPVLKGEPRISVESLTPCGQPTINCTLFHSPLFDFLLSLRWSTASTTQRCLASARS